MRIQLPDQLERRPTASLLPYARNARTHSPAQIEKIAASMREFGFTNPILVDAAGGIIAGHGRVEAAQVLELEEVPVIVLGHLTEVQKRAYILADNRLALDAGWDEDLLMAELADLDAEGFNLELTGFSEEELDLLLPGEDAPGDGSGSGDPDAVPDPEPDPISAPGDVWRLGPHRVMCGDSTVAADMDTLMAGDKAQALWTDPPYNVDYEGTAGKILNDKMAAAAFGKFLLAMFKNAIRVMDEGAAAYVAHADTEGLSFRAAFIGAGFKLASCLIWRKNSLVLGRADYHWQHEPILYGWKPGAAHNWYGDRNKTTVLDEPGTIFSWTEAGDLQVNMGESSVVIRGDNLTVERAQSTVFLQEKPKRSSEHPTMKPVALIERQLANSAARGFRVLDLCGGSGSTLIACEGQGMHARIMELDPRFVDVIVRRWQDFTGRTARHEATEATLDELAVRRGKTQPPKRRK